MSPECQAILRHIDEDCAILGPELDAICNKVAANEPVTGSEVMLLRTSLDRARKALHDWGWIARDLTLTREVESIRSAE